MRTLIIVITMFIIISGSIPLYSQKTTSTETINLADSAAGTIQNCRTLYSDGQYVKAIHILHANGLDTMVARASSLAGLSYSAINDYENALSYLKKACILDSTNVSYRFQLGTFLSQCGFMGDAEREYRQIITLDSTFLPAFVRLGIIYNDQKLYQQAQAYFAYVVEKNPRDYLSNYYLGTLSVGLGQKDTAMYFLGTCLQLNNGFVPALDVLASLWYSKKDYRNALELYQKAFQFRPATADFIYKVGLCNRQLKEYAQAIACFSRAVAIDTLNASYLAQLGYCYFFKERYDSSIYYSLKAISYDNENYQYYANLALSYQKLDSTDRLVDVYKKMIDLHDPDEIANLYTRIAAVYSSTGHNAKAISAYKSALAIAPSNPIALFFLGSLSQQAGNFSEARWAYEEYLHITVVDSSQNTTRKYVKSILKELNNKPKQSSH
jgi:tetratricopeptide (TPR) repeat protein